MTSQIPEKMRALVLGKAEGKPGQVYHPVSVKEVPIPEVKSGEVLVKLLAGAMNHRDLFIRQSLYPGIIFDSILGADGVGKVVSPSSSSLYGKTVLLAPAVGWLSSPDGPDQGKQYAILGGVKGTQGRGTFAEYIAMPEDHLVECPAHLAKGGPDGLSEAAALPLGALTAYRATFTKGKVSKGQNVLITGIGGGVAITALQLAVAAGANVWVTSGSQDKLETAKKLGAKGGVSYKDEAWPKQLAELLPKEQPLLDVVIDSAGGPIGTQVLRILKDGGKIVCYGQTTGKEIGLTMSNVLKNQELLGSTMGSFQEFKEAIRFADEHKIVPVVHKTYKGLDQCEDMFVTMKEGSQFGKLVVLISQEDAGKGKL